MELLKLVLDNETFILAEKITDEFGEAIVNAIDSIFNKLEESGFKPKERLAEIADQSKKTEGMCFGDYKGLEFMLWGGLSRLALRNTMVELFKLPSSFFYGYRIELVAKVLKIAMTEEPRLNLLVRSIINGVRTYGGEFDEMEQRILKVLYD